MWITVATAECACLPGGHGRDLWEPHSPLQLTPWSWEGLRAVRTIRRSSWHTVEHRQNFLNRWVVGTAKGPINGNSNICPMRPCDLAGLSHVIQARMGMNGKRLGKGHMVIRASCVLLPSPLRGQTAYAEGPPSWSFLRETLGTSCTRGRGGNKRVSRGLNSCHSAPSFTEEHPKWSCCAMFWWRKAWRGATPQTL